MILAADVSATIVIYIISTIYKNASFYDPYWSVAPAIIVLYWFYPPLYESKAFLRQLIVLLIVFVWAIRLTYNWARQWKGLYHEDWRYSDLRNKKGNSFWFTNLIGIHLMPTILVFLGCLSFYPIYYGRSNVLNYFDLLGLLISLSAVLIEALADQQLYNFLQRRKNSKMIMDRGLWRYSRHPNYFGEILFWWGLYFFALASDLSFWWVIIGPLLITILFCIVSIPLIEKRHLVRKPSYPEYQRKVSKLIPWFSKMERTKK